jgi:hypothetical protein
MEKVVSIKQLQYERAYRMYYADQRNVQFTKSCFFKSDVVNKTKIS